jgi:hypothetical protein
MSIISIDEKKYKKILRSVDKLNEEKKKMTLIECERNCKNKTAEGYCFFPRILFDDTGCNGYESIK